MSTARWPTYRMRPTALEAGIPHERGSIRVRGSDGRSYLDAVGGIGCASVGHGHPRLVDAISKQAAKLMAASNVYPCTVREQFAERLAGLYPEVKQASSFLCSTGTESNEAALKLVLKATGRDTIVAFERAFHGRTLGSIALASNREYRSPFVGEPGEPGFATARVVHLPFDDEAALERCFAEHGSRIAAVWFEPIQGEGGVYPASRGFLRQIHRLCREHGALIAADEIQSGSGRTGRWSAWSTIFGDEGALEIDVLWVAKAMGGGFPVAACLARGDLAEVMQPGTHGSTFGGNPLACAAALAVVDIVQDEGLLESAAAQLPTLRRIAEADPIPEVVELRGHGAMIGIQVGETGERRAENLAPAMAEQGVLVTVCHGHTVRLLLPYRAGEAELAEIWRALRTSVEQTAS